MIIRKGFMWLPEQISKNRKTIEEMKYRNKNKGEIK